MSSSIIDKENAGGAFHLATGNRKFGEFNGGAKSNKLGTPKFKIEPHFAAHKSTHKENVITPKKRRALGDLLNTTGSKNRSSGQHGNEYTKCLKKLTNDFERTSLATGHREENTSSIDQVEKCIKQEDTFRDLFEYGKISDLLIDKNMIFIPRLPAGDCRVGQGGGMGEQFNHFVEFNDKAWLKQVKSVNKLTKRKTNDLCLGIYEELPELELPQMLEDF